MPVVSADNVIEILTTLRRVGGEPTGIEAKRASGGLPKSACETLSAFSNTDGGTLLLGVDQEKGFALVDVPDPVTLRDGLVRMSRDDITPSLQITTEIVEVEGRRVVIAEIPPAPADQRPVYVTAQGIAAGSYLRGGDGDRHMTEAEIAMLVAGRTQPTYDRESVNGSTAGDLDDEVEYPLEAVREAVVNALMHRDYSPVTRGTQVQIELFPDRLVVRSPGGLNGGVLVDELGEEGISSSRNAVLASLLADTYLPSSNELVAENRSSGIPAMLDVARRRGLPRPSFRSSITSFVVTMARSELLNPEVREWIAGLHSHLPTPAHKIALAMLREGYLTNEMLRQWGEDRIAAGQVLKDLVSQGLAIKEGGRRYAQYVLDPAASGRPAEPGLFGDLFDDVPLPSVAEALRSKGEATAGELADLTGLSRTAVLNHLRPLTETGAVQAVGAARSPHRRYRWVEPGS
jgi:predicted HTH transcriptional regulator